MENAELFLLEAKPILESAIGKENPNYGQLLNSIGILYAEMGQYEKAEIFLLDYKSLIKNQLGSEHPDYAQAASNLGFLYWLMSKYEEAWRHVIVAKIIREKTFGKEHSLYTVSLKSLIRLSASQSNHQYIDSLLTEYFPLIHVQLARSINHLSQRELAINTAGFQEEVNLLIGTCLSLSLHTDVLKQKAYNTSLFYKGFLLTASNRIRRLAQTDSVTTEQYNLLKSYHRRLAAEYTKPTAERKGVPELESKADSIEKVLVRTVAGFGEALRQVEWQEVRDQLKPGEAAVEFIHYRYYNPKPTDSTMYAALVLRPGDEAPQFIHLFEEREIAPLLKGASGKAFGRINALYSVGGGKSLYDLIRKPLEKHLEGVKTVYCSPSGLLHRLNFGPVSVSPSGGQGAGHVVVLGSTRQLVLPDANSRTGTDALLVGGVRYASDTTAIAAANAGIAARDWSGNLPFNAHTLTRGINWDYLPESAGEVLDIQNVLQSANWTAKLDTGYYATEEAFRNIGQDKPSPRILHVATHGFFYPDPKDRNEGRGMRDAEPVFKLSEHPMIRSGLMLAGADEAWTTGKAPENREDGILTAYEISQMNLSNTELVVLSACETGLGDIEGNEGVYGLQRAFKIAGAKYLIMSLWKVSDQTTRELMTDFYRQWLENGLDIPAAFRKAQGNMKTKYPDAPYHWAGFVLVE